MKKKDIRKRLEARFEELKDNSYNSYQAMHKLTNDLGEKIGQDTLDFFARHVKGGLTKKKMTNLIYAATHQKPLEEAVKLDPAAKLAYRIIKLRQDKGWTRETLSHAAGVPLAELNALEEAKAQTVSLVDLQKLSNTLDGKIKLSFKPEKE
ncbi:helix-turn-helix domain-containing protein [Limosilactobacillus mucosae]|uniref:helix-turn-helix domain-containing protein n=1 Tax=Limosilactobacillus mucosae TaxID=97478 RepID=UPI00087EA301|nr:helix-turn-helix transcriptional regulator [Limosilactobacillus mucosae]SDN15679.1 Helix-turn-helix domain-containing protein [Limosilactobacillus mucosae]SEK56017.1 Helix-turn-helix domain-containing protein [Limosilactobacillus mucosae]SFJ99252.1 Helix-turn-helix domain-containing protein [Limosilactobacillus mucosae]